MLVAEAAGAQQRGARVQQMLLAVQPQLLLPGRLVAVRRRLLLRLEQLRAKAAR